MKLLCTFLLFMSVLIVSANNRLQIVKTNDNGSEKTPYELVKEIKGIVDTLEEKDSLLRYSYLDYCLDTLLLQNVGKYSGLYLAQQMCEDSLVRFFSPKQKKLYVETILRKRYYDLCLWNQDMRWGPVYSGDCICKFLIKNNSDEILNSVRNARDELSQIQCEECTESDHKMFYRELLLGLHDNIVIDSLFQDLIITSKLKKEKEIVDCFTNGRYMEWFKYRKEDLFDVVSDAIRENCKAYYRNWLYTSESSDTLIYYNSYDYGLISWLAGGIEDFPRPNRNDRIRLEFKGKEYMAFSDEYKRRVLQWMKEHRSDYVLRWE